MGKYSDFERLPRDLYPTPYEAVIPLLSHLPKATQFIEPCAGDGRLIRHLEKHGHICRYACDIEPQAEGIEKRDVLMFGGKFVPHDMIITNPPWERNIDGTGPLHDMIRAFSDQSPTWLLFDAGWMHTKQAAAFKRICRKIVSIGRVKWFEGTENGGKEDACWYLFQKHPHGNIPWETEFVFR